jgi:hypothetical protein
MRAVEVTYGGIGGWVHGCDSFGLIHAGARAEMDISRVQRPELRFRLGDEGNFGPVVASCRSTVAGVAQTSEVQRVVRQRVGQQAYRQDVFNCFLLSANLDVLFDSFPVSFSSTRPILDFHRHRVLQWQCSKLPRDFRFSQIKGDFAVIFSFLCTLPVFWCCSVISNALLVNLVFCREFWP